MASFLHGRVGEGDQSSGTQQSGLVVGEGEGVFGRAIRAILVMLAELSTARYHNQQTCRHCRTAVALGVRCWILCWSCSHRCSTAVPNPCRTARPWQFLADDLRTRISPDEACNCTRSILDLVQYPARPRPFEILSRLRHLQYQRRTCICAKDLWSTLVMQWFSRVLADCRLLLCRVQCNARSNGRDL